MNSLCFTIALNGYDTLFDRCIASQQAYCRKHAIQRWDINALPWIITAKQSAWLKVEVLRGLLEAGVDCVAFLDADCEIRDNAPAFDSLFGDHALMMAHGKSGRFNSGVIFVRRDRRTIRFLDLLIEHSDSPAPIKHPPKYENGHFIHFAKDQDFIGCLEHRIWNNNSNFDPKSYIQHYSDGVLRKQFMTEREKRADSLLQRAAKRIQSVGNAFRKDLRDAEISTFLAIVKDHFTPRYKAYAAGSHRK